MPTVLSRTFALLSNTKSPHETTLNSKILQGSVTGSQHISIELEEPIEKPEMSIWKAAEQGDLEALQYYVDHSPGIELTTLLNTRDPETDNSLIHLAIAHGKTKDLGAIVKLLLENGADASACDVYNVQPIHIVSLHHPQQPLLSLELLLNHKANPNATDGDGWTPLHYAARFCQPPEPAMDLLIARGADINRRDAAHKTPLFALLANGDHAQVLTKYDPDLSLLGDFLDPVTRRTRQGSLLIQACKYARQDCLALLVRSKAIQKVVSRQELQWAYAFVAENENMMACLQELEATLESTPVDKKHHGNRLLKRVHRIMKRSRLDENK